MTESTFGKNPKDVPINPKAVAFIVLGAIVVLIGFNSYKTINATEQGVVLRLGKAKADLLPPGLHFIIPFVDRVYRVETEVIHKEEFGYRSSDTRTVRTSYNTDNFDAESLRVTGDLNMAEVEWSVQYKIGDPYLFLFHVADPVGTLRDLSESVMCRVVGNRSVYEVLTVGRGEIEIEARAGLQDALDHYKTGMKIVALKLQNVLPPDKVKPSYNNVNEAEQYKEKLVNQAQEKYNSTVPKALGEAKQRLEQSEGYRVQRVNSARGEANKFIAIYEAYSQAKEVTKKRMYLETMSEILAGMDDVILVDEDLKSVLPLLNLQGGNHADK